MLKPKSLKYLLFAVLSLFFSIVVYAEVLQPKNIFKAFPPGRSFLYNGIELVYTEKSILLDTQNAIFVILEIYNKDGVMGVQKLSQDCYQRPSVPVTCYFIDMAGLVLLEQIELEKYEVIQTDYFSRQNVEKRAEIGFRVLEKIGQETLSLQQKKDLFDATYNYDLGILESLKDKTLDLERSFIISSNKYKTEGMIGMQKFSQECHQKKSIPLVCYFIDVSGLVLLEQVELKKSHLNKEHYFSIQNVLKRSETIFQLFGEIENKSWTERQKLESLFRLYYDYSDWIDVFKLKKFETKE